MKRILSMLLLVTLLSLTAMPSMAADVNAPGGTGSAPILLTAEATTFSVTVPTQLPISVGADGAVVTASDAKIVNESYGAVVVTNVQVTGKNDWTTAASTTDMTKVKVGTKLISLSINGSETADANVFNFDALDFPKLDGKNDTSSDELAKIGRAHV